MRALVLMIGLWLFAPFAIADPGEAVASVRIANGELHVSYTLDAPVTRFAFDKVDVVRADDFTLATSGLSFADDAVSSATPFRSFELVVHANTRERDAKYPIWYHAGQGGVLYTPALHGDPERWRTRLVLAPGAGETVIGDPADKGAVFIGPSAQVEETPLMRLVAGPEVPARVRERAVKDLAGSLGWLTESLGASLARKPVLVLSWADDGSGIVADVSPGSFIAFRLHGKEWTEADPPTGRLDKIIFHESFHFWNGNFNEKEAPTWLHEGGADYAALLVGLHLGALDEDGMKRELGDALSNCRRALTPRGDPALRTIGFLPMTIRYPCGTVFQWALDMKMRQDSGGKRTILDVWKDAIAQARMLADPRYTLADIYRAAGAPEDGSFQPVALIDQTAGAERWAKLVDALDALGARIVSAPTAESRRAGLLMHLLKQDCASTYGFFTGDDGKITLDTRAGCHTLAGSPVLASILGGSPLEVSSRTYSEAVSRCAAGLAIDLEFADHRKLAFACRTPLPPAVDAYTVEAWRP